MILILIGQTASGKTTVKNLLVEKFGFSPIITYTTRPKREGEENGVDYFFITNEDFNARKGYKFFAETTEYDADFGYCQYGSAYHDYVSDGNKRVVILNPDGARQIKDLAKIAGSPIKPYVTLISVEQSRLVERALKRGDKPEEINRRLIADSPKFDALRMDGYIDATIFVDENTDPEHICKLIMEVLPK